MALFDWKKEHEQTNLSFHNPNTTCTFRCVNSNSYLFEYLQTPTCIAYPHTANIFCCCCCCSIDLWRCRQCLATASVLLPPTSQHIVFPDDSHSKGPCVCVWVSQISFKPHWNTSWTDIRACIISFASPPPPLLPHPPYTALNIKVFFNSTQSSQFYA